jgi:hypothetical protein
MPTVIHSSSEKHLSGDPARSGSARHFAGVSSRGVLGRFASVRNTFLNLIAPVGYQDAAGFHYGKPPVRHPLSS